MVVGKQVVKAETLDGETNLPNSGRIPTKLRLRVHHANLHRPSRPLTPKGGPRIEIPFRGPVFANDALKNRQATAMLVVVIAGPIASGKSSLGRATAARLEELDGTEVAVIDLDLIYEMLDPRSGSGRAKNDEHFWSQARRVAGRLSAILLAEGRHVVAEGNFAEDKSLAEFERELPGTVRLRLVTLDIDFQTALHRTQADASRGLSKDPAFLSTHYEVFSAQWRERDVLRLNTGALSLTDATEAVTTWLTQTA